MWWRSIGFRGLRTRPDTGDWLDFALVGRDSTPASLFAQLENLDAEQTSRLRQRWAGDLARIEGVVACGDSEIGTTACAIPAQFFSSEHHWAVLMDRLRGMPGIAPAHWRRALQQYAAFLRACINLSTRLEQHRGQRNPAEFATTALFHQSELATRIPAERLGPGEAREFCVKDGQSLKLRLGSHDFTLLLRPLPALQDEYGRCLPLPRAKCQVGRHSDCDLCLGDDYRSVSRRHVLIELLAGDRVRLTDTSSYGTWVLQPQLFRADVKEWSELPATRAMSGLAR